MSSLQKNQTYKVFFMLSLEVDRKKINFSRNRATDAKIRQNANESEAAALLL